MEELRRLLLSTLLILASTIMYAQTEITGTVVDETGEPVIGATVKEKATTNGTVTDFDGNFKLKVNFFLIGLHYKKKVISKSNI